MRPRWRWWTSFWTIVAAIAGVIGAGAAVYPLISTDAGLASLAYTVERADLRVDVFSDPIVLTGEWYIKRGPRWWPTYLTAGDAMTVGAHLRNERIPSGGLRFLNFDKAATETWLGHDLISCAIEIGDLEVGVEYRSKHGASWARTRLPFCLR